MRQGGPKRKVSPAIVVRLSLLYRLGHPTPFFNQLATWRSGDAADCKSAYPGSIPGVASTSKTLPFDFHYLLPVLSNRVERLDKFCSPSALSWMLSAWRASRFWSAAFV